MRTKLKSFILTASIIWHAFGPACAGGFNQKKFTKKNQTLKNKRKKKTKGGKPGTPKINLVPQKTIPPKKKKKKDKKK